MKELRIGVVLYGGVSLAVYMNGVVTELWYLLRASRFRADRGAEEAAPAEEPLLQGYVALLDALAGEEGGEDLRVVVDTVAGTSAGGVNGAVLAKAIVEGADARVLNRIWVEEADIAHLRDEPAAKAPWFWSLGSGLILRGLRRRVESIGGLSWAWVRDQAYSQLDGKARGRTPLDGDYFCRMIARTLRDMGGGQQPSLLPDNNAFDLFLTATDLHGWPRHLPVGTVFHPRPLFERAHAHVSHFQLQPHAARRLDDFLLTFATRATAGFPLAFAPLTYARTRQGFEAERPGFPLPPEAAFRSTALREHELFDFPCARARLLDGGVLDNKPFSHLAGVIEGKAADREVYRCVLYVEPNPQAGDELPPEQEPDLRGLAGQLYALLRHEPVVEDLRRLQERNTRAAWIRRLRAAEADAAEDAARRAGAAAGPPLSWPPQAADLEAWRRAANAYAAAQPFGGYSGYVALKARRAVAALAEQLCHAYRFPYASRQAFFVRRLLRTWFDTRRGLLDPPEFDPEQRRFLVSPDQERFLSTFDLDFRQRRMRHLVARVNQLYRRQPEARHALDAFKRTLADAMHQTRAELDAARTTIEAIGEGLGLNAATVEREIREHGFDPEAAVERHHAALERVEALLGDRLGAIGDRLNAAALGAIRRLGGEPQQAAATALVTFPFLDVTLYPLMQATGVEDPVPLEVMRISPADSVLLAGVRPRLASLPLGAFAGFLDRKAREHDLLLGRLDGVERLVELLLVASCGPALSEAARAIAERHKRAMMARLLDEAEASAQLRPLLGRLRPALQ